MRLLDSKKYISDLKKAVDRNNLSMLHGKTFFVTGGLGLILFYSNRCPFNLW